ncbi:hypothetical protein TGVAND_216200 [Toxoplasma gondii VAND]|nr:hypothetical protein TGVAND_216200 [Toxoplasma gondii VAND]
MALTICWHVTMTQTSFSFRVVWVVWGSRHGQTREAPASTETDRYAGLEEKRGSTGSPKPASRQTVKRTRAPTRCRPFTLLSLGRWNRVHTRSSTHVTSRDLFADSLVVYEHPRRGVLVWPPVCASASFVPREVAGLLSRLDLHGIVSDFFPTGLIRIVGGGRSNEPPHRSHRRCFPPPLHSHPLLLSGLVGFRSDSRGVCACHLYKSTDACIFEKRRVERRESRETGKKRRRCTASSA